MTRQPDVCSRLRPWLPRWITPHWLILFVAIANGCAAAYAQDVRFDLVIRGGTLVDGTGNPRFRGDIGVIGDQIAAIGHLPQDQARREIDAAGLIVAPGFIDIHSHSDWTLLTDGDAQSKIRQGVTTEILGEGASGGPNTGRSPPRTITIRGETRTIVTLDDYFRALEESTISVNVASYVGLNNLWQNVMGDSFEQPDSQQLARMCELLDDAMQAGALGLSTQVMTPPGSLATTDQLVELALIARRHGGIYSTHIRNEGLGVFDAVDEAITVGARADIPVDIIHLKIADEQYWGRMNEIIERIELARSNGVQVQANVYPYTRGNNDLRSIIPPWAHEGGNAQLLQRLQDPQSRERLRQDIEQGLPGWYNHYTAVGKDWSRMLISARNSYQGLTMDRVIAMKNQGRSPPLDPLDVMFDLLIEQHGSVSTVFAHHAEPDMNLALIQSWCSIGSDGSALAIEGPLRQGHPHPRSFGTFPRVLGRYVRELNLLTIEDAVRKMTSLNAAKVGLFDRGLLRPGLAADMTVFDPQKVTDLATYTEPFQYSLGIEFVVVNGQVVLAGSRHTGARPGKVLRHRS